jgi:hypothetical protein
LKTVVQLCRFHLLQFHRRQPVAATLAGILVLAMLASAVAWALAYKARQTAAQELADSAAAHKVNATASVVPAAANLAAPDLPAFSSAELAADFHAISADVKLPLDEVRYTLDSGASQPYLRYRVTLVVKTGYPEIRRFAAALVTALPNVALDSVRCGKEDGAAAPLSCQLAFSAFYRKGGRG